MPQVAHATLDMVTNRCCPSCLSGDGALVAIAAIACHVRKQGARSQGSLIRDANAQQLTPWTKLEHWVDNYWLYIKETQFDAADLNSSLDTKRELRC